MLTKSYSVSILFSFIQHNYLEIHPFCHMYQWFLTLYSVQSSLSVMSDSLWLHGLQHARPSCPSPTPGVYPNSCPLSWWCHPTIWSSAVPFSSCLQSFPASGSSNESVLHFRRPKYWTFSFSMSLSNEYSGLISFKVDWFDLLAVQETLRSLLQHHSLNTLILQCSACFMAQHSHPYMTTGKTKVFFTLLAK